jgi:transcriptional regulator with XRE-family HTH domain
MIFEGMLTSHMTDLTTFGGRLRYLRKAKCLTQAELAEVAGIARSTYTGYENGIDTPARETLIKIADHFEASLDWIEGRLNKVNMPQIGQFVNDIDELTLLSLWGGMCHDQRNHLFGIMRLSPPGRRDTA